jgi:hypothetical protein
VQVYSQLKEILSKKAPWIISAISIGVAAITAYPQFKEATKDAMKLLPGKIERSKVTKSASKNYVERPGLVSLIKRVLNAAPIGGYWVVYGPKGVGKSEAVDHTAINQRGVVKLLVTSANSKDDIIRDLTEKLLGTASADFDVEMLISAIEKSKVVPTIIFDVERGGSPDQATIALNEVRGLAKQLAMYCRCIIVLSEANAALEFGRDKDREKFIYVDEMTVPEAKELVTKLKVNLTEEEMQYVFSNIGTRPASLIKLQTLTCTLKQHVERVLADARQDLVGFPHKAILKALKEHPEGVPPKYFNNQKSEGVDLSDPRAVGVAMKRSNFFVYNIKNRLYRLISTAHKTVLRSYDPIVKESV